MKWNLPINMNDIAETALVGSSREIFYNIDKRLYTGHSASLSKVYQVYIHIMLIHSHEMNGK